MPAPAGRRLMSACCALASLVLAGLSAAPAASALTVPATPAVGAQAAGGPPDRSNVGATHSPELLRKLAGAAPGPASLLHPAGQNQPTVNGPVSPAASAGTSGGPSGAVPGVDVASFQHPKSTQYPNGAPIGWSQVAAAGYQFAAIKATEGNYYVNPFYSADLAGAKSAGLSEVGYAFANPYPASVPSNGTAAQQAQYLVSNAAGAGGTVPPLMLDIEYNPYSGGECYALTPAAMVTWISDFVAEIKTLTGQLPIIYTTQDWWATCTASSTAFSQDPLWFAAYGTTSTPPLPASWGNWGMWQYTSSGTVPGITTTGATDVDALNLIRPGTQYGTVGQPSSPVRVDQYTSGSAPGLQYSATGLPAGLSIDSTGQISGTPAATGPFQVSISGLTAAGVGGSASFSWNVAGPVTVTAPPNQQTVAGSPVGLQVKATDSAAGQTLSYSASGLPPGLSISSAGLITGWPTQTGSYPVQVTATDGQQNSGSASFSWTVTAAPDQGPTGAVHFGVAGKCLDDAGNSSASGARVDIWTCTGGSAQQWTLAQDRTVRIHGMCMSVSGSATVNGSKVVLAGCTGSAGQQWAVGTAAELVNTAGGKCLAGAPTGTNGTQAWIAACSGQANQKWTLPAGPLVSQIPGLCMDDLNSSSATGNPVVIWSCDGRAAQNWAAQPDGTVRFGGKCLDVYHSGTASGTKVDLYSCNGSGAQQWQIVAVGAGQQLKNPQSALCLSDPGDTTASGAQLVIGACSASDVGTAWRLR